jgi:hypothetical protein
LTIVDFALGTGGGTVTTWGSNLVYQPEQDFFGTATFTYTVSDGNGGTATATVTVIVEPINDAPVAEDDIITIDQDTVANIVVASNDTDVEGGVITVVSISDPGTGAATLNSDGTVTYTPKAGFSGTDVFTYTISDDNGGNDTATVTVTIKRKVRVDTPEGDDVVIDLVDAVVQYERVTGEGPTTLSPLEENPHDDMPAGFPMVEGTLVEIATSASWEGTITVGLRYDEWVVTDEDSLRLFYWDGAQWKDITSSADTKDNIVYGEVTDVSTFFIGEADPSEGGSSDDFATSVWPWVIAAVVVTILMAATGWVVWRQRSAA